MEIETLPPNGWGLYQMHGNVWEWVQDAYASYSLCPTDGSAYECSDADYRCMRGGSWTDPPNSVRLSRLGLPSLDIL